MHVAMNTFSRTYLFYLLDQEVGRKENEILRNKLLRKFKMQKNFVFLKNDNN